MDDLIKWLTTSTEGHSPAVISEKLSVQKIDGLGRGVFANSHIHGPTRIIEVPRNFLLNLNTVKVHLSSNQDVDVYCALLKDWDVLLAVQIIGVYLCIELERGVKSFWKPFVDHLPDIRDFILSPVTWPHGLYESICEFLPNQMLKITLQVIARFEKDYRVTSRIMQPFTERHCFSRDRFLWAWMCINSRCLYMDQNVEANKRLRDDNFTLVPFVDFINHTEQNACRISVTSAGFNVLTTCDYKPGEQIMFNYGPHPNELLCVEYGFMLLNNRWNYLDISQQVQARLLGKQAEFLREMGYYGDYTVNVSDGPSFRTVVALAALSETEPSNSRKLKALINGQCDGGIYRARSLQILCKILDSVIADGKSKVAQLEALHLDNRAIIDAIISLHKDLFRIGLFPTCREVS